MLPGQGADRRALGGSDYPHPEGLLWPAELADELEGMSAAEVRLVMRDNLAALV